MGFGSTAKKVQKAVSTAEDTYAKLNELVEDLQAFRDEFQATSAQIDDIERELAEQRAVLETLADEQGVDVEEVVADGESHDPADDGESHDPADDGESVSTGDADTDAA